jgi:hypothetical protein
MEEDAKSISLLWCNLLIDNNEIDNKSDFNLLVSNERVKVSKPNFTVVITVSLEV